MVSRVEEATFLPPAREGSRMFSSTFRVPTRLNIWKMNPTRSRRYTVRAASDMEPRSSPSTVTVPESGGSSPPSTFSRVLFPEPLAPMTATNSPWFTVRLMSFSTAMSSEPDLKLRLRRVTEMTGELMAGRNG